MAKSVKPINSEIIEDAEIVEENGWESDATISDVENDINEHSEQTKDEPDLIEPEVLNETQDNNEKKAEKPSFNAELGGEFLLFICDSAIPAGLKFGIETFNKKKTVDAKAFKLEYDEKEMLRPSANETAKILFANMTPVQQFLIGISVIYMSKFPDAVKDKENV